MIADEVVDIFIPVRFCWVHRARRLKLHAAGLVLPPPQPEGLSAEAKAAVTSSSTAEA
jgi:hypothetical protein